MKDKTSLDTFVGQAIGIDRNHPDYLNLFMAVYILGGNFSSRLMQIVRDKEGLTYSIRSFVEGAENLADGFWGINGSFASTLLEKGLNTTLDQVKIWIETGVTEDELKAKKTTITGSYKVQLSTSQGLASRILKHTEWNKPISYLDEYPKQIDALQLDQVNQVIKRYVKEDLLVNVTAGTFGASK